MIYAFKVVNVPAYSKVLVACIGFDKWSDTDYTYSEFKIYPKDSFDDFGYLNKFLAFTTLHDTKAVITTSLQPDFLNKVYRHFGGIIPALELTDFNTPGERVLGVSVDDMAIHIDSMQKGNKGFVLLSMLSEYAFQRLEDDKTREIKELLKCYKESPNDTEKSSYRNYVSAEEFSSIENNCRLAFPEDIKYFYENIGADSNDFYYELKRLYKEEKGAQIIIQISSLFAYTIIKAYSSLSDAEKQELNNEILNVDSKNELASFSGELEYILKEGVNFYDFVSDSFKISFLQCVYESMKFKQESIKVVLVTWAHCGGWGGLILRGANQSYDGGGMHGYYLETEFEGVFFEYNSNYYHASEQHHLVAYKDVIIK